MAIPERGPRLRRFSDLLQDASSLNGPGQILLPDEIRDAVDLDWHLGHSQDGDEHAGVTLAQDNEGRQPGDGEQLMVVVLVRAPVRRLHQDVADREAEVLA